LLSAHEKSLRLHLQGFLTIRKENVDICEYKTCLKKGARHPWEIARARFIGDLVGKYFWQREGSVQLLDFGCGDGFVTGALVNRYEWCCLVGIDNKIHEINSQRRWNQHLERITYFKELKDADGEDAFFDGALLLDVLEHIAEDELFLEWFLNNKVFAESAKFVITCPAFGKLFSRHDFLLGHFRRYSLPELRGKIEGAGGIHLESGYIFIVPFVLRAMEVLVERMGILGSCKRTHLSTWRGGLVITSVISRLLYFDALLCRALRRFPLAGLTCYVICRKQAL
jgi:SAM-dependent methyltransferase